MNRPENGSTRQSSAQHYSEEEWIDWIEGQTAGSRQERMRRHLEQCPSCTETVRIWRPLLAPPAPEPDNRRAAAVAAEALEAGSAGPAADPAILLPRDAVRRSIRRRVRYTYWRRHLKNRQAYYRGGAAALVLCGALLFLLRGLYSPADGRAERTRYINSYEPQALAVMNRPETVSYRLDQASRDQFSGNVWYNGDSGELFVLIDDVALGDQRSLQAWLVNNGRRDALGLLQIEAAKGHLYIKDRQLGDAENFALTVEPAGGSERPTSPDAVWLPLPKP
ncbi:anti-sigma factor ['Paenibacillus yunnanensis' Narsing Rao et al. 2020]|uniref:anti-sigma factor n=1 Tax=Paenibacillus tengchongensis TaxID=2608684 RepID=UPI00124DDC2C|nr:anti-sigma factor [Paenibacillus tengchongensis]